MSPFATRAIGLMLALICWTSAADPAAAPSAAASSAAPSVNAASNSASHSPPHTTAGAIAWQRWNAALFAKARAEHRFVILDLQAIWCHWCHVMDEVTYRDPTVTRLIGAHYIAVRVDQDSDPDLAARYEDYGWPATIVFAADGTEIVKRQGYMPPALMSALLQAIVVDPSPGPSVGAAARIVPATTSTLTAPQRAHLLDNYFAVYDTQYAGWGDVHKFIHADSMEYALTNASVDARLGKMAKDTLNTARALLDPVWGGVYQYSDERDWQSPHYEKIMSFQTQYIRLYSAAYRQWRDPRDLLMAKSIENYLHSFLTSTDGAFYTSQDADVSTEVHGKMFYALSDKARRAQRNPGIDQHIYARENGWAITALCALYDATSDSQYLERAQRAANWVITNRSSATGGFRHGEVRDQPSALADNLSMAQALLALYVATGERTWLQRATSTADFIATRFTEKDAGYVANPTQKDAVGVFSAPVRGIDDNIGMARLANSLAHYTSQPRYRDMAVHAMRYLASTQIVDSQNFLAGVLLADQELANPPTHITIIGHKDDAAARQLHQAALSYPAPYRRIEWWDKREGAMPNPDVQYPELARPAAFVCTNHACSTPLFEPARLTAAIKRLSEAQP